MDFQENVEEPENACYSQFPDTKNPRGGSPTSIVSLSSVVEDNEEETRHIFRMMELADRTSLSYSAMSYLASDPFITNRTSMVEWMMGEYLHKNACEIRDTSVRIMDIYLALQHSHSPEKLQDHCFLAFVGAASMILASKLHQSQYPITAACFTAFNTEELARFETQFVLTAGKYMSPLCTPSSFLPYILDKCKDICSSASFPPPPPPLGSPVSPITPYYRPASPLTILPAPTPTPALFSYLETMSIQVIGEYLENPHSMLYAPSTIAIGGVYVCLSLLQLPVDTLIHRLPGFMLKNVGTPFFREGQDKEQYMDISSCIQSILASRQSRKLRKTAGGGGSKKV